MAGKLQKAVAIIGGLIIGVGATFLVNKLYPLPQDYMIILGVILTVAAASSIYFMTKGSGGGGG